MGKDKRRDLIASFLVFSISIVVYLKTLCPTLYVGDSGELVASAYLLDIPHSPGFPLWCLLARLFTLIPIGNIAWRVNLSSAFFASCLAVFTYLIMKRTTGHSLISISTALLVAFSRSFWDDATVAEAYTLIVLLMVVLFYLLLLYSERKEFRYLYLASLIFGLSLAIHRSMLVFLPIFIPWLLFIDWRLIKDIRRLLLCFFFLLLGLALYLYLPLRSLHNPAIDWGNPQTLSRFWAHVVGRQYGGGETLFLFAPVTLFTQKWLMVLKRLSPCLRQLYQDMPPYISWLALIGLIALFREKRAWFFVTLSSYLLTGVVVNLLINLSSTIPSFFFFTLWVGYGIRYLMIKGAQWNRRLTAHSRYYSFLSGLLILALPISSLLTNYPFNDRSRHFLAYDYGMNVLATLDKEAILFIHGDNIAFSLTYLKLVENERPDVTIYDQSGNLFEDIYQTSDVHPSNLTREEWLNRKDRIEREIIATTSRPVYYCPRKDMSSIPDYELRHTGLIYRVAKKGAPLRKEPDYYSRYNMRGVDDETIFKDKMSREIVAEYHYHLAQHYFKEEDLERAVAEVKKASEVGWDMAGVHYNFGLIYDAKGIYDQAIEAYGRAIEINPDFTSAYDNLGVIYAKKGRFEEAIRNFEEAITLDPDFPSPHNNLGVTYGEQGRYEEALQEFAKALKLDPDFIGIHYNMGLAYYRKGDWEKAGSEFEKVSRSDPNYRTARQYLRTLKKEKPR